MGNTQTEEEKYTPIVREPKPVKEISGPALLTLKQNTEIVIKNQIDRFILLYKEKKIGLGDIKIMILLIMMCVYAIFRIPYEGTGIEQFLKEENYGNVFDAKLDRIELLRTILKTLDYKINFKFDRTRELEKIFSVFDEIHGEGKITSLTPCFAAMLLRRDHLSSVILNRSEEEYKLIKKHKEEMDKSLEDVREKRHQLMANFRLSLEKDEKSPKNLFDYICKIFVETDKNFSDLENFATIGGAREKTDNVVNYRELLEYDLVRKDEINMIYKKSPLSSVNICRMIATNDIMRFRYCCEKNMVTKENLYSALFYVLACAINIHKFLIITEDLYPNETARYAPREPAIYELGSAIECNKGLLRPEFLIFILDKLNYDVKDDEKFKFPDYDEMSRLPAYEGELTPKKLANITGNKLIKDIVDGSRPFENEYMGKVTSDNDKSKKSVVDALKSLITDKLGKKTDEGKKVLALFEEFLEKNYRDYLTGKYVYRYYNY